MASRRDTETRNHATERRPYSCEICGQSFKRSDHMRRHVNTRVYPDLSRWNVDN